MEKQKLNIEDYLQGVIINEIKSNYNKYNSFGQEDFEDLFQSVYLDFIEKVNRTPLLQEMVQYVESKLNDDNRFKDIKFKQNCNYIKLTVKTFAGRNLIPLLGLKKQKYKKNEDGVWELQKNVDGDLYEIEQLDLQEAKEERIEVLEDFNKNIDLNIFYEEIQKYANILLCLMQPEQIEEVKSLKNANGQVKQKFIKMFKNLIINIETEVKGFDDDEIKEFWIEVLKTLKQHKDKNKNEQNKRFINTRMFNAFKDIYY